MKIAINKKKYLEFNKNSFDAIKMKDGFFEFSLKHSGLFFMIFFLVTIFLSSVLIYKYIYSPNWSKEQQDKYLMEARKDGIEFKIGDFRAVVDKVKQRNAAYDINRENDVRDIFVITE